MCLYFLATGFCNIDWWASAMHCNFIYYVCASSILTFPPVVIVFWHDCLTCKSRNFYLRKDPTRTFLTLHAVYLQKQVNLPASTRQAPLTEYMRLHVIKHASCGYLHLQAGFRLTYLQLAGEVTRVVTADCLQLCSYFCLRLQLILPAFGGYIYLRFWCFCLQRQATLHVSRR